LICRFLITGKAGFFGTILKRELMDAGHTCVSLDIVPDADKSERLTSILGDIRDKDLVERIFPEHRFDAVFHCAAMLAHDTKHIQDLWTSNVDGTKIIADAAIRHSVKKLVFTSSNCLWAKNFERPVTEEEPPAPIEIYGKSKWEDEKILFACKEKLNSVIFRCPTIMDEGRLGLLGILFEFIDENRKLWMVGDGMNRYQFIYAKDLVQAFLLALNYDHTEIFNIGSDNVKTFNEVYGYVLAHSDSKSRLAHFPRNFAIACMKIAHKLGMSPLGHYQYKMIASSFVFDTTKIKVKLGFTPTKTNEEMLLKAYEFYHENRKAIQRRKNVSAHNECAKMGIIRLLKWLS